MACVGTQAGICGGNLLVGDLEGVICGQFGMRNERRKGGREGGVSRWSNDGEMEGGQVGRREGRREGGREGGMGEG